MKKATAECLKLEATLVQIDDKNYDYLAATVSSTSGNDNWIGGGQLGGKSYKKAGTKCPIIRGSGSSMGPKISTLDCSVAAPFICGYNPMPAMPAYPPGYGYPAAPPGYPGYPPPAGYPQQPVYPGQPPPGYGAPYGPPGADPNAVPGLVPPPMYGEPASPEYGAPASPEYPAYDGDYAGEEVVAEEEGGGSNATIPILIILLVVIVGFGYRYYKQNYANKPEPPAAKPAPATAVGSNEDDAALSPKTPQGTNKNILGWKGPQDDSENQLKSFDNPVFRDNPDQYEAEEFKQDELPPGMTMDDPRKPNTGPRKSKRGEHSRYHDEQEGSNRRGSSRKDKYRDFEIPEGKQKLHYLYFYNQIYFQAFLTGTRMQVARFMKWNPSSPADIESSTR